MMVIILYLLVDLMVNFLGFLSFVIQVRIVLGGNHVSEHIGPVILLIFLANCKVIVVFF